MKLIGKWDASSNGDRTYMIYRDEKDYTVVYPNNTFDISFNECMENLAVILNSPQNLHDINYSISVSIDDTPTWECEYSVTGSKGMTASVYAYGGTPNTALSNCIERINFLQQTYNPGNLKI